MEDGTYGAAVQAELGRAKLAGLMIDKKEIGLVGAMYDVQSGVIEFLSNEP